MLWVTSLYTCVDIHTVIAVYVKLSFKDILCCVPFHEGLEEWYQDKCPRVTPLRVQAEVETFGYWKIPLILDFRPFQLSINWRNTFSSLQSSPLCLGHHSTLKSHQWRWKIRRQLMTSGHTVTWHTTQCLLPARRDCGPNTWETASLPILGTNGDFSPQAPRIVSPPYRQVSLSNASLWSCSPTPSPVQGVWSSEGSRER